MPDTPRPVTDPAPITLIHLWTAGEESLCGLAKGGRRTREAEVETATHTCASCLLLVSRIRRQAVALLDLTDQRTWPTVPTTAWAQLEQTRWRHHLDLETFLARPDLNQRTRYDAIRYDVDPDSVTDLLAELRDVRAQLRQQRATAERERNRDL